MAKAIQLNEKTKLTKKTVTNLLAVVDKGLTAGVGRPIPGKMCVEAAICYALGEPHNDHPKCVQDAVIGTKIMLNDHQGWGSNKARAEGLRRLAIAQLGTKGTFRNLTWHNRLIDTLVPRNLELIGDKPTYGLRPDITLVMQECWNARKTKAGKAQATVLTLLLDIKADALAERSRVTHTPKTGMENFRDAMCMRTLAELFRTVEDGTGCNAYELEETAISLMSVYIHLKAKYGKKHRRGYYENNAGLTAACNVVEGVLCDLNAPGCKFL